MAVGTSVSGDVAFDSHGHLAIAGTSGADGFVTLVDRDGTTIYSHALSGANNVTSIAVDADDNVVFAGWTTTTADLLGVTIVARSAEGGRDTGAFVAKLDAASDLVFARGLSVEARGVAVDASGKIAVNGAQLGHTGFGRIEELDVLTASGDVRQVFAEFVASGDGRGFGVAADACGSIYATFDALDTPVLMSPLRAYLVKISP